jgi:hypothetical protein
LSEDINLAKYLLETGFPDGFTEENNADPDGDDDLKFTSENI